MLTDWQHFVASMKDFESSFALLCWRHRYYLADNWVWLALYFKVCIGPRLPHIWQLPYGTVS